MLKKELTAPRYKYDSGLRDQNAITYVLKQEWADHQSHVLLVNKQYCLNCYWRDLLNNDLKSDDTKVGLLPQAPLSQTRLTQMAACHHTPRCMWRGICSEQDPLIDMHLFQAGGGAGNIFVFCKHTMLIRQCSMGQTCS